VTAAAQVGAEEFIFRPYFAMSSNFCFSTDNSAGKLGAEFLWYFVAHSALWLGAPPILRRVYSSMVSCLMKNEVREVPDASMPMH
jgi:hypothetical protein